MRRARLIRLRPRALAHRRSRRAGGCRVGPCALACGRSRRAQATLELLALLGAVVALAALGGLALRGGAPEWARHLAESIPGHRAERRDDRWALRSDPYGPLIRRYVPTLVLERDRYGEDAAVPSDPAICRRPWCAAVGTGRPTIFTHVVRRAGVASGGGAGAGALAGGGAGVGASAGSGVRAGAAGGGKRGGASRGGVTFIEYWFYYPDSRTLHAPVAALEGYHRDDWEGLIVRIPDDGEPSARVTAHQWLVGVQPGWRGDPGWRPIPPHPAIYRAAGSHANGFARTGIDVPLDAWNGDLATLPSSSFTLIAADTAPALRFRYDSSASPPWLKELWTNPEATTTGRPPSRAARDRVGHDNRADVVSYPLNTHSGQRRRSGVGHHIRAVVMSYPRAVAS